MTRREIALADVEPFRVGELSVVPALRTVRDAQGRETTIEPRVMQCLVVLSERAGSVVSREDLLRACWGGMTVGDDAVNRCMSRLRALGAATGAFGIDTIPRVGFRLRPTLEPDRTAAAEPPECVLAVSPIEDLSPGQEFASLAKNLSGEIVHRLSRAQGTRIVAQARGATHALSGYLRHDGEHVRVVLRLVTQAGEAVIWSERYDVGLTDPAGAVDEVAAAVTHAVKCRLDPAVRGGIVDPVAYDLYLRTRRRPDQLGMQALTADAAALRDVVARAPAFAEAWGSLAYAHALLAAFVSPVERAKMRASAKDEAMRALALDSQCATAAAALAVANPAHENIGEHMHWLNQALTWHPDDAATVRFYSRALAAVGRNAESLAQARRAAALDPQDPYIAAMLGRALCESGAYAEAETVLRRALRRWPKFELISIWLCVVLIAMGNRTGAAELAASHELGAYRADIDELLSDQSGAQALTALRRAKQDGTGITLAPVLRAAEGGHAEEALRIALGCGIGNDRSKPNPRGMSGNNPALLFGAWQPAIRRRPLFVSLCDQLGLVAHWAETGVWPDCANDASLPYDFRKTAEGLAGYASTREPV
jgi:DNA-binding winged helix-turn-helix (wHTH) protein/tetratricopeptide (TPR) repeat protein